MAETRAGAEIRNGTGSSRADAAHRRSRRLEAALAGGPERHHEKTAEQGKLPVRERVARLVDPESFAEEALLANWEQEGLGADGVVTGLALIGGRKVALMANDPTVKAGSWGPKTVEKILRIQERALQLEVPMVYLVDSAGARITDQVQMFPGRRGAGRIFHNEVRLSGRVPQVCLLFGPSAAGGAYIPAFCDVVIMRDGQRVDVPRLAADGRDGDRREGDASRRWAGPRCTPASPAAATSWCRRDEEAIDARQALPLLHAGELARARRPRRRPPSPASERRVSEIVPADEKTAVRRQGADRGARRRGAPSSRSTRAGPRSWSSATRGSTGARSGSSPTSRS